MVEGNTVAKENCFFFFCPARERGVEGREGGRGRERERGREGQRHKDREREGGTQGEGEREGEGGRQIFTAVGNTAAEEKCFFFFCTRERESGVGRGEKGGLKRETKGRAEEGGKREGWKDQGGERERGTEEER